MPEQKQILVGGFNATNREKEKAEEKPKKNTKKKTTTKPKKTKPEPEPVVETNTNVEKELEKMDNLPSSIQADKKVEDGKVQIDLSAVFGEGTYAEIEGEEAQRFIEEQNKASNQKVEETKSPTEESHQVSEEPSVDTNESIDPVILKSGNPKCYAYMSLKATGIYRPDIISFALVTEEGKAFYAEMKDIDIMKITPSVLVNVIHRRFNLKNDDITESRVAVTGDEKYIRAMLLKWIREEFTDKGYIMQIVSDKVVNEFGLFMEFLLNGIPLDQYSGMVSPVCIDLNTILADSIDIGANDMSNEEFIKNYIPAYIAASIDRLGITGDQTPVEYLGNALVNAQCIRASYRRLYGLDDGEEHVDLIKKRPE